MRFTVEQLRGETEARGFTTMFRNWIRERTPAGAISRIL
jgi:hypothetical protein